MALSILGATASFFILTMFAKLCIRALLIELNKRIGMERTSFSDIFLS